MKILTYILIIFSFFLFSYSQKNKVDLVLYNGTIYTLDPRVGIAQAVAISGDEIVFVGKDSKAASIIKHAKKTIDLHGKFVYPGFVDAHAHIYGLGKSLETLDLTNARGPKDVIDLVKAAVQKVEKGEWIEGRGWDQNKWPGKHFPDNKLLSEVSPENPVFLTRIDGHAAWVNNKALEMAGILNKVPKISGGEILVDANSHPLGILVDNAMEIVRKKMPKPSQDVIKRRLLKAMKECARFGLTQVHDAGINKGIYDAYIELAKAGKMPIRIWAMLGDSCYQWLLKMLAQGQKRFAKGFFEVRSVKMYADGALGSRGAWLLKPYSDRPSVSGLPVSSYSHIEKIASLCVKYHFQACTHAIGDRANREVLDIYERVLKNVNDGKKRRFRIEHAQVLSASDVHRFASLGIIPSMQPTHATSDMSWAEERLGKERCRYAYAWQTLLKDGCKIPMGSDFPVEHVNPLFSFYAAITRQDRNGKPLGGWFPEERMSRKQALASMTKWATWASFQENDKGILQNGKWADLTVCDSDIMKVKPLDILKTRILMTIVGGKIIYAAK